jgi:GNAT superfamily N-acetyltransferase
MTGVTVREDLPSDLPAVHSLYRDLHDGDEPADPVARAAAERALAAHPGAHLFLAEVDGEPVSSCVLFVLPNLSRGARPFGLVENVVTRRDSRNRGYATALLGRVLAVAWAVGCYKVMLLTGREDRAVHRLYAKAGFMLGVKTGYVAYPPDTPL